MSVDFKTLEELGSFKNGVNFNAASMGEGLPLINVKDITDHHWLKEGNLQRVNIEVSDDYYAKKDDIFFVRSSVKRDGIGLVGKFDLEPSEAVHCGFVIRYRPDNRKIVSDYLLYLLKTYPYREKLKNISSGAAHINISQAVLKTVEIPLPPIGIQRKIATYVKNYDDLIENNRRRIQLLEEAPRLLYKEWFVQLRFPGHEHVRIIDGVPEGWDKQALGNFVEVKKGKNITQETVEAGDVPVVAGGLKPAYYHSKSNANGPVITVSASGANAGYVNLYHQDIWASDCSYISCEVEQNIYFRYLQLKNAQEEIFGMQHGAAQPHVYPNDLARLVVFQPVKSLLELFEGSVFEQFELIKKLKAINIQLTQARDILLPRLMTGELAA